MAGFVRRHGEPLFRRIRDRVLEPELFGQLRLLEITLVQRVCAAAQRPHQRLVEEVLDHHRRIAGGHGGKVVTSTGGIELGNVRLALEEVVDQRTTLVPAREVELDGAIEATRAQQRGVEVGGAVGGREHQYVRRDRAGLVDAQVLGQQDVHPLDEPALETRRRRRLVEGLQLDQQLIDDPGDAFAATRPTHAGAGGTDGVDLFDEPDGAAIATRGRAQRTEVGADLAVGLSVVHRLERRRRHEQERHARLARHCLGDVRLARSRWPLEEHAAPRGGAELVAQRLMREEQVERAHDLFPHDVAADDVVETDLDVVWPIQHVRRTAGSPHRQEQHAHQQHDDDEAGCQLRIDADGRQHRLAPHEPQRQPEGDAPHGNRQAPDPAHPRVLTRHRDVGLPTAQDLRAVQPFELAHADLPIDLY